MPSSAPHIVALDRLKIGHYVFDFQLDNEYLTSIEKTELLGGTLAAKAVLDLRERDFTLVIGVRGEVQVTCDRCLDAMDVEIDVEDEMDVEPGAKELDLKWLAYELIIVNLPLVHCHPEGGCNPEMDALLHNHLCCTSEEPDIL